MIELFINDADERFEEFTSTEMMMFETIYKEQTFVIDQQRINAERVFLFRLNSFSINFRLRHLLSRSKQFKDAAK